MADNAIELNDRKKNWFILRTLVSKDFKLKYRRSILGVAWSVLNPLLMMVVMSAVFSFMFRFQIENYPLYLILGNIMFTMMANATSNSMLSIMAAAPLIKKVRVEKLVFPLESILFDVLNFCISLIAVVVVMLVFQVMPTLNILLLPLLVFYVALFSLGLGLVLSSLAIFFRDVIHLWSVILTAWTYATPIFYPMSLLPEWMQALMVWNPMYQYLTYFRDIIIYNNTPDLTTNLICFGMAAITFLVGLLVFRKTEHKFILYL